MRFKSGFALTKPKAIYAIRHPRTALTAFKRSWHVHSKTPALQFSPDIRNRTGRSRPKFDWLLSTRTPPLLIDTDQFGRSRIRLHDMYAPRDEIRQDSAPYLAFGRALSTSGILRDIDSVLDLGCSTGFLIQACKSIRPEMTVQGVEAFQYQKDASPISIRNDIHIHDLRDSLPSSLRSDLVVCTEVGEHIDPASLGEFLGNLVEMCGRKLVLTWSSAHPPVGAPPQHVSSLSTRAVRRLMRSYGFKLDRRTTREFERSLRLETGAYYWWFDSLGVWNSPNVTAEDFNS